MIIKLPLMLHNIVSKQFKISHVPCDIIVFKKEDVPSKIKKLIDDQYDEKFLEDCDTILFIKGPIDKDMRKKIFKAADKALGEGANMMNETDFRLLKLHDDDNVDFGQDDGSDDSEEKKIDDQVAEIVNEPDDIPDDNNSEDEANGLEDNDDAVQKSLETESIEDNSISSAVVCGKSISQWVKEFNGEFTAEQLWRMARSGTDLQRLLLTINGHSTLDDSELNEDEVDDSDEDSSEDESEDEDDGSEEDDEEDDTESDDEDDGSEEDDTDDSEETPVEDVEEQVIPTRYVFLKISMKN